MSSIAVNLALKFQAPPPRVVVTPGQLYRLLSAEFRQLRPPRCTCRMPMVVARERLGPQDANWSVERGRSCGACAGLVSGLVGRYAERYDMAVIA